MKKVIITGISGQDGSYMAEYCLELGHKVFGVIRRTSQLHDKNYRHLIGHPEFKVIYGDLFDSPSLNGMVTTIQPDYFINFAAQSFVGNSWEIPEETFMAGAVGVLKCLEAIRINAPSCRFYNAGSSEQFGDVAYTPQDEKHPFRPRSPYGAAKSAAHLLVKVYRESYGLYAVQGLLFNHESEKRGTEFVTRKITKGLTRINKSINLKESFEPIYLGNLDAKRDWSHALDFIDGIWKILNQEEYRSDLKYIVDNLDETFNSFRHDIIPNLKEYVLASGQTHTVRDFVNACIKELNFECHWEGEKEKEILVLDNYLNDFINLKSKILIKIDPAFYRPAEVDILLGDSSLARKELGWEPKITFDKLVQRMIQWDKYESGITVPDYGKSKTTP